MPTPINLDNVVRQLSTEEGTSPTVYKDSLGNDTIGIGRLVGPGGGLSSSEIRLLLDNDIHNCLATVQVKFPWAMSLDDARLAVLVEMIFQLGYSKTAKFPHFLQALQAGDYDTAADEMINSVWHHETPARVERLAQQMRTNVYVFKSA